MQLALVPILATRWRYLHWLQIWSPDGATWHYQLVLSLYLHQLESHQLSLQKVSQFVSLLETSRPIDRTPGTPGSDKNALFVIVPLSIRSLFRM